MPGFYDWQITPYLKEILDCLSPTSYIREIDFMKGAQIGGTVGVLENIIGYLIDHVKTSPVMLLTADNGLSKIRMEKYITPMLKHSDLYHLIKSSDDMSHRKTGKTDLGLEWEGGGFLLAIGAKNIDKLRSVSIEILLQDEVDTYKKGAGQLAEDRTAAYEMTRKIFRLSTPEIEQTSVIRAGYLLGDRREYHVPCKHCGSKQKLVQYGINKDTGATFGLDYKVIGDQELEEGSVVYLCKFCQGKMVNDDKLLMNMNGAWVPTVRSTSRYRRSYQISSLYSPPGMQSWDSIIRKWLQCWDVKNNKPRDMVKLQYYYNNVLGVGFKVQGSELRYERVIEHRRNDYVSGKVPNLLAEKETGHRIQVLTCAVDVHKRHLDIHVIGWIPGQGFYSIDWFKWEGRGDDLNSEPWEKLRCLILDKVYESDTGEKYRPQLTLIDSGYLPDTVYEFCNEFSVGVHPIVGRKDPIKSAALKEFSQFDSRLGIPAYNITTTIYKDRLMVALTKKWDFISKQPLGYANFPGDYPDSFFNELTVENKRKQINPLTNQVVGYYWYKPENAENHAWDLTVYAFAALDMIMFEVCSRDLGLDQIDRPAFWKHCKETSLFVE